MESQLAMAIRRGTEIQVDWSKMGYVFDIVRLPKRSVVVRNAHAYSCLYKRKYARGDDRNCWPSNRRKKMKLWRSRASLLKKLKNIALAS